MPKRGRFYQTKNIDLVDNVHCKTKIFEYYYVRLTTCVTHLITKLHVVVTVVLADILLHL